MSIDKTKKRFVAFSGISKIAEGDLAQVARGVKAFLDRDDSVSPLPLLLDAETSEPVEIDFRGTVDDVLARLAPQAQEPVEAATPRTPGRPKLGVVAREVTLLPRHWEWLASQSGGASATLRKLVEQARRTDSTGEQRRRSQDSAYRFLLTIAGNEPGFEEAIRALYADDAERFATLIEPWPADIRNHAQNLTDRAFSGKQA